MPRSFSGRLVDRLRGHTDETPSQAAALDSALSKLSPQTSAKPGITGRFQAGIAEFLLITRLRARREVIEPAQSADVIANGAKVVQVTCKDWFGGPTEERSVTAREHYRTRL